MKRRHLNSRSPSLRLSIGSVNSENNEEDEEEMDESEDEEQDTKRSNFSNQTPALPILRSSQNGQISYTPFDELSEEATCAIFLCLPPMVNFKIMILKIERKFVECPSSAKVGIASRMTMYYGNRFQTIAGIVTDH